jgi:hypothetical protein
MNTAFSKMSLGKKVYDPARIDIHLDVPIRVRKRKITYILPIEQGGGTEVCFIEELAAVKKKT